VRFRLENVEKFALSRFLLLYVKTLLCQCYDAFDHQEEDKHMKTTCQCFNRVRRFRMSGKPTDRSTICFNFIRDLSAGRCDKLIKFFCLFLFVFKWLLK